MYCQFCHKECKNASSLRNHERMCPNNPDQTFRNKFTTKGRQGWNKGLTKETNASVRKYANTLTKEKPAWQAVVDDDGKLYQRYANKRVNAAKENIGFNLTFEEFCHLVSEAELVSSQLGFSGDGYVLARYNDHGDYEYGNCRFITQKENAAEKVISEASIESAKRNIVKASIANKSLPPEELSRRISEGIRKSEYYAKRIANSKPRVTPIDTHNSQYGTFWITNGTDNMKWSEAKGPLPDGFYKGRVCNKSNK